MHILIIHPQSKYFGGTEKLLGYFLAELVEQKCRVAVAVAPESRVAKLLPKQVTPVWIQADPGFSWAGIWQRATALKRHCDGFPFDLVHGWAARDWELAAVLGWRCRRPVVGTLHDHPNSVYLSSKRQRLMRWCANYGLKKLVCVSFAVRRACEQAGYSPHKLAVVLNGLPAHTTVPGARPPGPFRIGFLGAFSELKGLRDLFQIVDEWSATRESAWELHLGGGVQDAVGERLLADLRRDYGSRKWWPAVHWHGWVERPQEFVRDLDLLIMPSREFESFGLVAAEAGLAGVPVLAARVGGVSEIVLEGKTGWLFDPGDVNQAVKALCRAASGSPESLREIGRQAARRVEREFSARKMVAEYLRLYSNLAADV